MTKPQTALYFREWGAARKTLRAAGYSPKDADAERTQIHLDNDLPKSSRDFNKTTHLDKFIAACRAICGKTAIDVKDQERKRLVHTIGKLGLGDDYLNHLASKKHEGPTWQALPVEKLTHLLYTATQRARSKKQEEENTPAPENCPF